MFSQEIKIAIGGTFLAARVKQNGKPIESALEVRFDKHCKWV